MVGCSNPQRQSAEATAQAFLDAIGTGDFEAAKAYCTEGTRDNLDFYKSFAALGANPMGGNYKTTRVEENGDYATVYYEKDGEEHLVRLHKTDGKWEVIVNKGDLANGGKDKDDDEEVSVLGDVKDEGGDGGEENPADVYLEFRRGKSATETAEGFLMAWSFGDFDKAKRYASESTASVIELQKGMSAGKKGGDFKVLRTEDLGEYANVYYREGDEDVEKVLKLGKDGNGNWEVIMTKDDFNGDAN